MILDTAAFLKHSSTLRTLVEGSGNFWEIVSSIWEFDFAML